MCACKRKIEWYNDVYVNPELSVNAEQILKKITKGSKITKRSIKKYFKKKRGYILDILGCQNHFLVSDDNTWCRPAFILLTHWLRARCLDCEIFLPKY